VRWAAQGWSGTRDRKGPFLPRVWLSDFRIFPYISWYLWWSRSGFIKSLGEKHESFTESLVIRPSRRIAIAIPKVLDCYCHAGGVAITLKDHLVDQIPRPESLAMLSMKLSHFGVKLSHKASSFHAPSPSTNSPSDFPRRNVGHPGGSMPMQPRLGLKETVTHRWTVFWFL